MSEQTSIMGYDTNSITQLEKMITNRKQHIAICEASAIRFAESGDEASAQYAVKYLIHFSGLLARLELTLERVRETTKQDEDYCDWCGVPEDLTEYGNYKYCGLCLIEAQE